MEGLGMNRNFWKGRKVLVTGHTGFKGSWLSLWLQELKAQVIGYALPCPDRSSLFEIVRINEGMTSVFADIRDLPRLSTVIEEYEPEIVFHMAAQALVFQSYSDPVNTYATNLMGTTNLLEAVRRAHSVRAVVVITSDKCYENRGSGSRYRETAPLGGRDPYSSSKACAELVVSAYRDSFFPSSKYEDHGIAIASARAGNVIGGGDWSKDRLVPDVINAFMSECPAMVRRPNSCRPWQFVLEPLGGYIRLAEKLRLKGSEFAEGWNFGPVDDEPKPVHWVVDHLAKAWGNGATWDLDLKHYPEEADWLYLDCSKAEGKLGWSPRLTLQDALKWTVEWYLAYEQGKDLRSLTRAQIAIYEHILAQAGCISQGD